MKLISEELVNSIVAYLKSRPLGEVIDGYNALLNLQDAPEEKKDVP